MHMKISAETRLSTILRHHRDAVQAISGISAHFKKLQNPILRKLMAPRVNLAQAAKIGGCSLNDFKQVLEPLGFEFDMEHSAPPTLHNEIPPDWFRQLKQTTLSCYDVRDELSKGKDPLSNILQRLEMLPTGEVLCIINSFIPEPLIHLIEKKNTGVCYTETIHPFEFHTYILKQDNHNTNAKPRLHFNKVSSESFIRILTEVTVHKKITLDVRELEMPLPMQKILSAVKMLQPDQTLHVLHKRVPVHLLEALDTMPLSLWLVEISDSDVQLLIKHSQ